MNMHIKLVNIKSSSLKCGRNAKHALAFLPQADVRIEGLKLQSSQP